METIKRCISCSRCPRVEYSEISLEDAIRLANEKKNGTEKPLALELKLDGVVVSTYAQLCSTCRSVVMNLCDGVSRKADKVSAHRTKKQKKEAVAALAAVPPSAAPAKPVAPPPPPIKR